MSVMPSSQHDAIVRLFRDHPQLAVEILRDFMDVDLPATSLIRVESNTFNTRPSDDFQADLVIVMGPPQAPAHAIIVEAQQDKAKDPRQLARYAAALWLLLRCDVTVLVVCPSRRAAAYYAQPIESGLTGYQLHAWVLGPDDISPITDPHDAAAHLTLSAISVMMHGLDRKVIDALTTALADTHKDYASQYYEYAYSMSGSDIRSLLEEIMQSTDWPVYSPFAREHFGRGREVGEVEGEAKGKARSVLLVLEARDFNVSDDVRTRITTCADLTQLERWITRAITIQTIDDLFLEEG
jgi:hypothetical protein